jgi:hypothetical protein
MIIELLCEFTIIINGNTLKIEIIIINKPSILFIDSSGSLIFKDLRKTCI